MWYLFLFCLSFKFLMRKKEVIFGFFTSYHLDTIFIKSDLLFQVMAYTTGKGGSLFDYLSQYTVHIYPFCIELAWDTSLITLSMASLSQTLLLLIVN